MIIKLDIKYDKKIKAELINKEDYLKDYKEVSKINSHSHYSKGYLSYIIKDKIQGIYFFLDKNKNIIYIGRSQNIRRRINHHFKDYYKYLSNFEKNKKQKIINHTHYIAFFEEKKEVTKWLEPYLINKYNPIYNTEFK